MAIITDALVDSVFEPGSSRSGYEHMENPGSNSINSWTANPPVLNRFDLSYPVPDPMVSEHAYWLYDTPPAPHNVASQTLSADPPVVAAQSSASQSFYPYSTLQSQAPHNLESLDSPVTLATTFMGPPANSRKRKAPTLSANAWEPYKARVLELHIAQKIPLPEVKRRIEEEFGFIAEYVALFSRTPKLTYPRLRQYRTRISQWKKDKNVKPKEMSAIVRKRQKRRLIEVDKGDLDIEVRGNKVEPQKISRWMKSHHIPDSFLYAPSPVAPTPSDVVCRTISDRGTPVPSPAYSAGTPYFSPAGIMSVIGSPPISSPALSPYYAKAIQTDVSESHPPLHSPMDAMEDQYVSRAGTATFAHSPPIFSHGFSSPAIATKSHASEREPPVQTPTYSTETPPGSPAEATPLAHVPQISSPVLSISDIIEPRFSTFAGQSPVPTYQVVPGSPSGSPPTSTSHQGQMIPSNTTGSTQPRYQQAKEEKLREKLSFAETLYGAAHTETLNILYRLGQVLICQGRYKSAENVIRRLLKGRRLTEGDDGVDTLRALELLAEVSFHQGLFAKAEKLREYTLKSRKALLGAEHRDTLISMGNLVPTYIAQGRLKQAEKLALQVMETRKRVLGEEHPETLNSMYELALTYLEQGRLEEAKQLNLQETEMCKKVLGEEHPDTLTSVGTLAVIYNEQGRWKEAEELGMQVLETSKRVLGVEHPYTLCNMIDLAITITSSGQRRWKEAEELEVHALETSKRVLGARHPDTLECMNYLAETFRAQGRCVDAVSLMEECVHLTNTVHGPQHPRTISSLETLRKWKVEEQWDSGLGDREP